MAYRDSFEQCPRDRAPLVDAGAVRACEQCQGQWVEEPILAEMILRMLPSDKSPLGALYEAVLQRGGEQLGCPTCGDKMELAESHAPRKCNPCAGSRACGCRYLPHSTMTDSSSSPGLALRSPSLISPCGPA